MKNIFICDDELIYREQLNRILVHTIEHYEYPFLIAAKTKGTTELLEHAIDHTGSIYFLDVNIIGSPLNGFELGKEIRRRDPQGVIIFITTFEELAFETFRYRLEAMDYIVKDQPDKIAERVALCLESIMEQAPELEKADEAILAVKFADEIIRLKISDVIFIETSPRSHMVIIHTTTQTMEVADRLQSFEDKLPDHFIRSHRSFLVNKDYIKTINLKQNTVELTTGHTCLVSRRMKKSLKESASFSKLL